LADKTLVTATVQSGGLTLSNPGVAAELSAFNAFVRWAGGRMAICLFRRGVASSEAESIRLLEGRLATLEREAEMRGVAENFGGEPSSEAESAPRVRGGSNGPHCVLGPRIGIL